MSEEGRKAMTKVTLLFASLPRDHPEYQAQQDVQTLVVGALFGGALLGLALGMLIGALF